jgi:hypothetical protein
LKSIFSKNLKFEDSKNSLGLQLSDILITAIRRSMNGNLQLEGWKNFGEIMLMGEKQTITLMNMSDNSDFSAYKTNPPYFKVIDHINRTSYISICFYCTQQLHQSKKAYILIFGFEYGP